MITSHTRGDETKKGQKRGTYPSLLCPWYLRVTFADYQRTSKVSPWVAPDFQGALSRVASGRSTFA